MSKIVIYLDLLYQARCQHLGSDTLAGVSESLDIPKFLNLPILGKLVHDLTSSWVSVNH